MNVGGYRLVSVCLGAVAALLLVSVPPAQGQDRPSPTAPAVVVPQMNDCLMADPDDAWDVQASIVILDCSEVHNAQVFKTMPYPASGERPSVLMKKNMIHWLLACEQEHVLSWLGAPLDTTVPLRLDSTPRLPTDKQWEAGARWVVCTASHPKPSNYGAETTGTLPDLFASTPRIQWVNCPREAPVSGRFSFPVGCTTDSPWMFTGYGQVRGKVTKQYPSDLQAAANVMCARHSAAVAKTGPRVRAFGALFPKNHVAKRDPHVECFIPLSQWNGKL